MKETLHRSPLASLRPSYDGPESWLWFVGAARLGVLLIVAAGATLLAAEGSYTYVLPVIFAGAFISSTWYLITLRRRENVSATLTWTQVLVDFGVVAATISFTQGQGSFFTFLLVIVILEAGVLMGLAQGFVFGTLAAVFMFFQFMLALSATVDPLTHWYNYLLQLIAFLFTAFFSGYWNQRLSRMRQFQREILDNMSGGFLITDTSGIIIAVNKAACTILGLVEENVAGRHVDGVMRPDSGAECPVTTALRLEKDFTSYEFYAETGTGSVTLLGLTTNRLRDGHGKVTGIIASFTDLTEMARMRQDLQQQDRMAVIGELSAGLAHEIRNPVAAIRGAMEELQRNLGEQRMVERLAVIAVRESDHLSGIVHGFLDFARDPGRRHESLDLRAVLLEVREQLARKYAASTKLTLKVSAPENPCTVVGNETQMRQVFMNLGQNGIEAMNEDGTLLFSLLGDRSPVEVQVEDQGPGIAPDKVARIFEPFFSEKEHGVGMGLAICMRIVTSHDGTIQVGARPGGGTRVTVRLPGVTE